MSYRRIKLFMSTSLLLLTCLASPAYTATIDWAGHTWNVREWQGNPGPNEWSTDCVWTDSSDRLHLTITNISGTWYCGEVSSTQSFSFGEYRWYVDGRPDLIDSNAVIGLFTYFGDAYEIDIEFSYNFQIPPTNLHYTIQPWWVAGHQDYHHVTLTNEQTTHRFIWHPRRIEWQSWYGHTAEPANTNLIISSWIYEGDDVPGDTNEHVHMNVWLYDGLDPADPTRPDNLQVTLADFYYVPATGTLFADDFEDGTTNGMWEAYGDVDPSEQDGVLDISPDNSAWSSLGYRTTNTLAEWADDGLSYIFSAVLRTVTVTAASSSGDEDMWGYQGLVFGENQLYDPYWATNAAHLRAGYDAAGDTLTVNFHTKTDLPADTGALRFSGVISNAATYFSADGIELQFALVYSNYHVNAYDGTNPITIHPVSGSATGLHTLGSALYDSQYVVGGQNGDDGRGSVHWESIRAFSMPELGSSGLVPEPEGPPPNVVQIGELDYGNSWRSPCDTTYDKMRAQVLYDADQIGRSGTLTQLQVHVLSPPPRSMTRYTIRMQHTAETNVTSTFDNSGWTVVYQDDTLVPAGTSGWYSFSFTNFFEYDNSSNLLVDFSFNNTDNTRSPIPALLYGTGDVTQCYHVSSDKNDPLTWTTAPGGRKFQFLGNRFVTLRLAFSNNAEAAGPVNMSFEDGPRGYLTNVPGWSVSGPTANGYIEGGASWPAEDGTNLLKLWDGEGIDELVYQDFLPGTNTFFIFSGYLRSQSLDDLNETNVYAALVLEWYASTGQISTLESEHFTAETTTDEWIYYAVSSAVPDTAVSGRIVCAFYSATNYTGGSVLFDDLSLFTGTGPPPVYVLSAYDGFDDNEQSDMWTLSGNHSGADFGETNGLLRVQPGSSAWQTSGYISSEPYHWDDQGGWFIFSAMLRTVHVDSAQSGDDHKAMLEICSEQDNAWLATNAMTLEARYDVDADNLTFEFLSKTNYPEFGGHSRFSGSLGDASRHLSDTGGIRMSIVLGNGLYDVRFSDTDGLPLPVITNSGLSRSSHNSGTDLHACYWLVGAMNISSYTGFVQWDFTELRTSRPPACIVTAVGQTSTDGSGIVSVSNFFYDADGDTLHAAIEASTNGGQSWHWTYIGGLTSTLFATTSPTQHPAQVYCIATTNAGISATNHLSLEWNTLSPVNSMNLNGATETNTRVRITAYDTWLSAPAVTGTPFLIDNEAPAAASAVVTIENAAAYTLTTVLNTEWAGFTDSGANIAGYYVSLTNEAGTDGGTWSADTSGVVTGATPDAVNCVYVWARDLFGNIGTSRLDDIIVLSPAGDWDDDALPNEDEEDYDCDALDRDTDGDDISDGWEVAHGLAPTNITDAVAHGDDDGYDNLSEFYWGTDPTNTSSSPLFVGLPGQVDVVRWWSATGRLYTLYTTDQALSNRVTWSVEPELNEIAGTGGYITYTGQHAGESYRIYRLRVCFPDP